MNRAEIAKPFGQISPRDACSVSMQYRFYKQLIVFRCRADLPFPSGRQVFDPRPLVISKRATSSRHGGFVSFFKHCSFQFG